MIGQRFSDFVKGSGSDAVASPGGDEDADGCDDLQVVRGRKAPVGLLWCGHTESDGRSRPFASNDGPATRMRLKSR